MTPKLIKTEKEHAAALSRIEEIFTAQPGTPEGDELELLVHLVDEYETATYPMDLPDPIAAIRFRMEQQGLKQKDLEPYLGSKSKVSEVLRGHRELSLSMIRKLNTGLGIPAEVLLREPGAKLQSSDVLEATKGFPLAEMRKRGWLEFKGTPAELREQREDVMLKFFQPVNGNCYVPALNRQRVREGSKSDPGALQAWRVRVVTLACKENLPRYKCGSVTKDFLGDIVTLSYLKDGPLLAREMLNKRGIHVVVERHLPKTHLDGAAICMPDGSRLIALTARHDRLDNFWFTLLHELAHVALHLDKQDNVEAIFDDLDNASEDTWEKDADALAREALIPAKIWKDAGLVQSRDPDGVRQLADKLRIHPAIIAGRIRYEAGDYKLMSHLVGNGMVRKFFDVD